MNTRYSKNIFFLILIFFIAYGLFFILSSSFIYKNTRGFVLFDDAMISMRYAENLADGNGLTWNKEDEKVEGYSNFLWTVYMAFWHLLPISKLKISLFIQLTGLLFLAGISRKSSGCPIVRHPGPTESPVRPFELEKCPERYRFFRSRRQFSLSG